MAKLPAKPGNEGQERRHLARLVGVRLEERRPKGEKMKFIASLPLRK
jgi:hypothetical protein